MHPARRFARGRSKACDGAGALATTTTTAGSGHPRPMITYDKGLPSLPDDITREIFGLLDIGALKSCPLTGKALSCSAKPFVHRTLYLTPRSGTPTGSNVPGSRDELKGLPVLGKHGFLQYTRHISMLLSDSTPLCAYDLQPYLYRLRILTNVRSLKICWLSTPSFFQKVEEYFGAFFGSLQSLELVSPRGSHNQILSVSEPSGSEDRRRPSLQV